MLNFGADPQELEALEGFLWASKFMGGILAIWFKPGMASISGQRTLPAFQNGPQWLTAVSMSPALFCSVLTLIRSSESAIYTVGATVCTPRAPPVRPFTLPAENPKNALHSAQVSVRLVYLDGTPETEISTTASQKNHQPPIPSLPLP